MCWQKAKRLQYLLSLADRWTDQDKLLEGWSVVLLLYYILSVGMVGGRLSWTPWPWHSWRPNWEQTQAVRQVEASLVTGDWFVEVIYNSSGEDWIKTPGRTEHIRTASNGWQDGIFYLLCMLLYFGLTAIEKQNGLIKKEAWIQKGKPYSLLVRKLAWNISASYIIFASCWLFCHFTSFLSLAYMSCHLWSCFFTSGLRPLKVLWRLCLFLVQFTDLLLQAPVDFRPRGQGYSSYNQGGN